MTRHERIEILLPAGWKVLIEDAAGGPRGMSALIRDALRREVKRRTKQKLPGELRQPGRPKKSPRVAASEL